AWVEHLPRERFVGLLKLLVAGGGVLVGNSSAGLIECAAIRVPVVNVGPRQAGRERAGNTVEVEAPTGEGVARAIASARTLDLSGLAHPYGDGGASTRIALALAGFEVRSPGFTRKRNAF